MHENALSRAGCPHTRPHSSYPIISFWPCSAYCKRRFRVISGWAKTACPCTHSFDGGCRWALGGGERGGRGGSRAQISHACICIQICQHGVAAQTLTHPETGPAKFVSKQHQIGTAPVCCTAKFYRRPGKYTPAPCPGSYKPARRPGPRPGASPFIPPSILPARVSVAWFTRNHREGNRYGIPQAGSFGQHAG